MEGKKKLEAIGGSVMPQLTMIKEKKKDSSGKCYIAFKGLTKTITGRRKESTATKKKREEAYEIPFLKEEIVQQEKKGGNVSRSILSRFSCPLTNQKRRRKLEGRKGEEKESCFTRDGRTPQSPKGLKENTNAFTIVENSERRGKSWG